MEGGVYSGVVGWRSAAGIVAAVDRKGPVGVTVTAVVVGSGRREGGAI